MYTYKYPHPAVTTDCIIFTFTDSRLKVLLIRRGLEPYKGCWALPGGFIKPEESADQCAMRELREETSLTVSHMRQFHTFSAPDRDPRERVITIAYYALIPHSEVMGGDDAAEADWFEVKDLPDLAFDHEEILRKALEDLRRRIHFEPVGFELLPEKFTMRSLQSLYEELLGVEFDRRNFHNKMLHLGLIEEIPEEQVFESPRRPARLYRFRPEVYHELKRSGFRTEF